MDFPLLCKDSTNQPAIQPPEFRPVAFRLPYCNLNDLEPMHAAVRELALSYCIRSITENRALPLLPYRPGTFPPWDHAGATPQNHSNYKIKQGLFAATLQNSNES